MTVAHIDPATGILVAAGKPVFPIGLSDRVVRDRAGRRQLRARSNPPRNVSVKGGAFTDRSPYRPHNARIYRFPRG